MKDRQKRVGAKGKLVLFAALALLLGGFGTGIGLNIGGSGSILGIGSQPQGSPGQSDLQPTPLEMSAPQASQTVMPKYEIVVSEKDILFNGKQCTLQSLRETLLADYSGTEVYMLVDNHAIKSVYDACKATLDELNISYVEK
jgi:hypothetical protein